MSVFDVAAEILNQKGPMTAMKLQKLAYYADAWSWAWDDRALFNEEFEGWIDGPVCRALYYAHPGAYIVERVAGNAQALTDRARRIVAAIIERYGDMTAEQLSDLTHSELPWIEARAGLQANERGARTIRGATMRDFYRMLQDKALALPQHTVVA